MALTSRAPAPLQGQAEQAGVFIWMGRGGVTIDREGGGYGWLTGRRVAGLAWSWMHWEQSGWTHGTKLAAAPSDPTARKKPARGTREANTVPVSEQSPPSGHGRQSNGGRASMVAVNWGLHEHRFRSWSQSALKGLVVCQVCVLGGGVRGGGCVDWCA